MNNFELRLRRIKDAMELNENLFPQKLNFENWTNEQLDKFIREHLEKYHKDFGIKNYEQAIDRLNWEFEKQLISKEELDIFLEGEKEFWKGTLNE